jgi:hypothetical protein
VGDDFIAERPVRSTLMVHREGVDGFWGHLGVLLPRQASYRWYPISEDAADMVAQEVKRRDQIQGERRSLAVETLNNRFLWINLATSNGVCLCGNAADWPQPHGMVLSGPGLDQTHGADREDSHRLRDASNASWRAAKLPSISATSSTGTWELVAAARSASSTLLATPIYFRLKARRCESLR